MQEKRDNFNEVVIVNSSLGQENFDLKRHIADIEASLINEALAKTRGVVAIAARMLGVRRTTLIEKMRRYNITRPSEANYTQHRAV